VKGTPWQALQGLTRRQTCQDKGSFCQNRGSGMVWQEPVIGMICVTANCHLMNTTVGPPGQLKTPPDMELNAEIQAAERDSAETFEFIQIRESTLIPVGESILPFRPSSHWGLNE
jgi:hypothetical protein